LLPYSFVALQYGTKIIFFRVIMLLYKYNLSEKYCSCLLNSVLYDCVRAQSLKKNILAGAELGEELMAQAAALR
jgi:hypothetical protein